ncbi:hypothetical protein E2C01_004061 [Portunus trituberculatus]|uniref:Uncharacterized protein n=1 Tax=Portunus trituberculatus TaxID=210409 RepID=A0A5B7CNV4_PORTR|nr:hypothetical protein [Portunus trituberculatus]
MASGGGGGGGSGRSESPAQAEAEVGVGSSSTMVGSGWGRGRVEGSDARIIVKTRGRRAGEQPLVYGTSRRAGGEEPLYAYITARDPPQMRCCNGNTWKEKIKFPYRTPLYEN